MNNTTEDKIRQIMIDKFSVDVDSLEPEMNLKSDLGLDSLDAVELIMELENEFKISIPDLDAENLNTIGDVKTCINSRL